MKLFLDFDGPILDNRAKYAAIYRELLKEAGGVPLPDDAYWSLKRARVSETDILARSGVAAEQRPRYLQRRQACIEDFRFLQLDRVWPGVRHWLCTQAADYELILVTLRKRRNTLLQQLGDLDLLDAFDVILSEDDNDGSSAVKTRLMAPYVDARESCLLIGDTESDIQAAKSSGIVSVGLTCGIRTRKALAAEAPDAICGQLPEVTPRQVLGAARELVQ